MSANYLATFHTHLSAMRTCRALEARGIPARMAPVPRKLSASCGTCVRYQAETPQEDAMHEDFEAIYLALDHEYREVCHGC